MNSEHQHKADTHLKTVPGSGPNTMWLIVLSDAVTACLCLGWQYVQIEHVVFY